ncbi:MAG: (d)CMP kinase [Candidatus Dormibacteraeota bacterium]|nr:(d)CMP kinase [Candidatus Dormibacteraeota bacterium]
MIVAIDGPAGSGKSAVGRRVAEALGLPFVDSGLMYRAIALLALERGLEPTDGAALSRLAHQVRLKVDGRKVWIDGDDYTDRVYSPELSEAASLVGKVAGVRLALVAQQRALGRPGVVMAGRDIGTVVFPDTLHKFFLTASVEERARRRAAQIEARGEQADPAQLRREVEERDRRDSQRSVAPMRAADDATVIDTNQLDLEATVADVLRHIREQS